ncbi:hypothetical protein BM613_13465 [Sulfoacidibacillus thermotolerans]|uniref:Uncharacterized protein n=1 Tax=Sulfoacidibacillus thermotolerans TaxID=1765684 RepID=A0A2U3D165_SULT2|nr:hypothetical protein BM613_13465 [Sulfoacidibacillus thermotolerans]
MSDASLVPPINLNYNSKMRFNFVLLHHIISSFYRKVFTFREECDFQVGMNIAFLRNEGKMGPRVDGEGENSCQKK